MPLDGKTIIVTRPTKQAASLAQALEQQGAQTHSIPLLEIMPSNLDKDLETQLITIADTDVLICVLVNVVELGIKHCQALRMTLPDAIIAVGQSTAKVFADSGYENVITSTSGSDSEALLSLDRLQNVTGNNIQLWRGGQGRKLLSDTLIERGAKIESIDLYQRQMPELSAVQMKQILSRDVDIICVTSVSSLENLFQIVAHETDVFADKKLLLGSQRIYEKAVAMGVTPEQCLVATDPTTTAMIKALITSLQAEGQSMTDKELDDQLEATEVEHTEASETVEELEPVPLAKSTKNRGNGFGTFLSVLAFLLAAGGIGGAYYLYEKEIKPALGASASQQEMQQLDSRLTQQSTQLKSMDSKVEQASEGVTQLRSAVTTERTTLTLAQVEHLVNIASDRLSYMSDPVTAESALQEATERLMDLDDPAFVVLEEAIKSDLQKVRDYQVVDANEVMSDLTELVESLRPLPVEADEQQAGELDTVEEIEASEEGSTSIGDVWNNFKKSIGEKVKVVETDYPVSGISSAAINRYKLDILRLRLEAMRLSLMRTDTIAFNTEIAEAQSWVIENLQDSLAQPILKELLNLRRINFEVMPDVQQSIQAVQQVSKTLSSSIGPETESFEPFSVPGNSQPKIDTSRRRLMPPADDCNSCVLPEPTSSIGAVL